MKTAKFLFSVTLALVFVASAVGCSGTPATTAPATTASATAVPATAVPATSAPASTSTVAAATEISEWDYWTNEPQKSQYQKVLDECSASTGITIDRQTIPGNDLISKVLLGAQQKQLPDLLRLDNPYLQQVADTGALAPLTDLGVDLTGIYPNLVAAGTYKGKVYGIAPGINGLALFYNKDMFAAANLQPPTTWAEIESDAAALTKNGVYGIAWSADANEEASWQFEPWFWGAGADLTKLDSPQAVQALQFWTDLVNKGYASKSVVQWSQGDVEDQFEAGKAAMEENGDWNLAALEKTNIHFGVVPIPMPNGGNAPGPMGGEVISIPNTGNTAKMLAAGKVANCLLSDAMMLEWANDSAFIPARESVAAQVAANDPNMKSFVDAASAELTRTGSPANLGPNYSKVSQPLWTAIESALTGAKSPQDALTAAQQEAESALQQ
jgi:multiple sugar transport system substrate-binding protein